MLECDRLMKAYIGGYCLGAKYARELYKKPRKINVEYIESTGTELEFTRLDGRIINYGRTLPF